MKKYEEFDNIKELPNKNHKLSRKTVVITIIIGMLFGLVLAAILEATYTTDVIKNWPLPTHSGSNINENAPSATSCPDNSVFMVVNTDEILPSPSPQPSHSVNKAELNQQIQDFLNNEGVYSEEAVQNMVFDYSPYSEGKLGVIHVSDEYAETESVLIDFFECGKSLMLVCGFHDTRGVRFVTSLEIAVSYYDELSDLNLFLLAELEKPAPNYAIHSIIEKNFSTPVALEYLEQLKGHCIILSFETGDFFKDMSDSITFDDESDSIYFDNFIKEIADKESLSKRLVTELYPNENETGYADIPSDISVSKITKIIHADENFEIDNSSIPMVFGMEYLVDYIPD